MAELLPIVFTVFEPSGDVLAARLIDEIKQRQPDRPIVALGGPRMQEAGAELLEETTGHAKMGFGAATEAKELIRRAGVLKRYLKENDIAALVPTDSPAANWSMCKAVRKLRPEATIVHLVGPQLWAWASWRIIRLRRLTDHVMCLLPFEPAWFGERGVEGTFVGHPLYEADTSPGEAFAVDGEALRDGEPRLALLPGSRPKEIALNWPTMLEVYGQVRHRYKNMAVTVAAVDRERAKQINQMCKGGRVPSGMQVVVGNASAVLDWADCALVVSGTASLEAASRNTPMVVMYNATQKLAWNTLGKMLIQARTFALPNVISESMELGRIVPEVIPNFDGPDPVMAQLSSILKEGTARQEQRDGFAAVRELFEQAEFSRNAADVLLGQIDAASDF